MMKGSVALQRGCLCKHIGPLISAHELVPWWLFCYYFMHSLDKGFGAETETDYFLNSYKPCTDLT